MGQYKDIKEFIKQGALQLGFDKCGVAKLHRVADEHYFEDWLERGYHGTMQWMENHREKRLDPSLMIEDAKVIVVFATNYYQQVESTNYNISRYALGDDYHVTIKNKLRTLYEQLTNKYPLVKGRYYVDTAPILERYWAQKAGIGWQGKNTNLITREFGSYVFLSEMILNVDLEVDQEHENFCGTCSRCLDDCPTQAFPKAYSLDSNRCISYLTIEHRDEFDEQQQKDIGKHIYGCDICQEVCPWNKFAKETQEASFKSRNYLLKKDAKFWQDLDQQTYQQSFKNSAVKRTKLSGLKRNINAVRKNLDTNEI